LPKGVLIDPAGGLHRLKEIPFRLEALRFAIRLEIGVKLGEIPYDLASHILVQCDDTGGDAPAYFMSLGLVFDLPGSIAKFLQDVIDPIGGVDELLGCIAVHLEHSEFALIIFIWCRQFLMQMRK